MKLKSISILSGLLLLLISCKSDKPDIVKPVIPVIKPLTGVFITNEGNFQWGNASVSYYKFSDQSVTEDIFKAVNNRPLGDVCQSMEIFNNKAYIVVNNSSKVEVVDPESFSSIAVISGLTSPRYFLGINSSKAYVTDFKSNAISVIDLNSNSWVKNISCPGWTEELVLANDKVFVTNMSKNYIYIINPSTDIIEDSIQVGFASNSIKLDKNGKLWVLCEGNGSSSHPGKLCKINPSNNLVELSLAFSDPINNPSKLDINGSKDTLYYLNNGVYQFPIQNTSLSTNALISANNFLFYGIGIDPVTGVIYAADAIDYNQQGKVYRYKPDGTLINSFKAGIIPGDFYFY